MVRILFVLSILNSAAFAEENWLCTEESSEFRGTAFYSCGIGIGPDENEARSKAFDAAKLEFDKVCGSSDNCRNHQVDVRPQRTTCSAVGDKVKCYRGVIFDIGESRASRSAHNLAEPRHGAPKSTDPCLKYPGTTNSNCTLEPAVKITVGMTKAELLSAFGNPQKVDRQKDERNKPLTVLVFEGALCSVGDSDCSVFLKDGKVDHWKNVKPELQDF